MTAFLTALIGKWTHTYTSTFAGKTSIVEFKVWISFRLSFTLGFNLFVWTFFLNHRNVSCRPTTEDVGEEISETDTDNKLPNQSDPFEQQVYSDKASLLHYSCSITSCLNVSSSLWISLKCMVSWVTLRMTLFAGERQWCWKCPLPSPDDALVLWGEARTHSDNK